MAKGFFTTVILKEYQKLFEVRPCNAGQKNTQNMGQNCSKVMRKFRRSKIIIYVLILKKKPWPILIMTFKVIFKKRTPHFWKEYNVLYLRSDILIFFLFFISMIKNVRSHLKTWPWLSNDFESHDQHQI